MKWIGLFVNILRKSSSRIPGAHSKNETAEFSTPNLPESCSKWVLVAVWRTNTYKDGNGKYRVGHTLTGADHRKILIYEKITIFNEHPVPLSCLHLCVFYLLFIKKVGLLVLTSLGSDLLRSFRYVCWTNKQQQHS